MEKITLMQWGEKRSVVYITNTETGESNIYLMDNNYFMYLDDLGLIS